MSDFFMGFVVFGIAYLSWRHLLYGWLAKTGRVCCRVVTGSSGHNLQVYINGREGDRVTAAKIPGRASRWALLGWVDELEVFEDGSLATLKGQVVWKPRRYGFVKYELVE